MNFGSSDWRQRRNFLHQHQGMHFHPMQYSILGYSTEAQIDKKYPIDSISSPLAEGVLDRLHLIPDPLKKNLADTVTTTEEQNMNNKKMSLEVDEFFYDNDQHDISMDTKEAPSRSEFYPSLTGIAGFFSSFFGAISGAMFQRRPKSPASQYYDCFDDVTNGERQGAPAWRGSKFEDRNKNKTPGEQFSSCNDSMNNCRTAVVQCESKLNVVKSLLSSKAAPSTPKVRQRRPRRVFVEPNSVEENFEDAFAPDDYISVEDEDYVEYFTIPRKCDAELYEIDAPKTKIEVPSENTEIVKNVIDITDKSVVNNFSGNTQIMSESTDVVRTLTEDCVVSKVVTENNDISNPNIVIDSIDSKQEIISSCEDKIAKLKSLLQGKKKKPARHEMNSTISAPEPVKEDTRPIKPSKTIPIEKIQDKRFKNIHRLSTDKRKKCRLKETIQEDILFANEIDLDDLSSVENSPKNLSMERLKTSEESLSETPEDSFKEKEYFDEVKGRFHSSSTTDSEDSFQIVFTDSPKLSRIRRPSDCDSEDSFIVFEDSPDSCYTSHEVFGEESNESGNESDSELSDSGLDVCKLSHSLSRTVSDLTDNSLYGETVNNGCDELDCAVRTVCEEISPQEIEAVKEEVEDGAEGEDNKRGLLLDEARKRKKKLEPPKKVTFSPAPPTVRVMRVWAFAARQARAGHWERYSRDSERFKRRIADVDMAVSWVLKPQHRRRVMFQRFMPWWNQQKRKEAEERKRREQEEKERKEREEKERIEREEMERIQREKEEKEEMKRLEIELREERNRADRERMQRRQQEKIFEKEQERLWMEEELRQQRFMEEQQRLVEEQKRMKEAQEKQQQILEEDQKQQLMMTDKDQCPQKIKIKGQNQVMIGEKDQQVTQTKAQNKKTLNAKEQQTQIKENQKTEKQLPQQQKDKSQPERKRLNKDKIEKFQLNAEEKDSVVKNTQIRNILHNQKEETNDVIEKKDNQHKINLSDKGVDQDNAVAKLPNQTQNNELSKNNLKEKIGLSEKVSELKQRDRKEEENKLATPISDNMDEKIPDQTTIQNNSQNIQIQPLQNKEPAKAYKSTDNQKDKFQLQNDNSINNTKEQENQRHGVEKHENEVKVEQPLNQTEEVNNVKKDAKTNQTVSCISESENNRQTNEHQQPQQNKNKPKEFKQDPIKQNNITLNESKSKVESSKIQVSKGNEITIQHEALIQDSAKSMEAHKPNENMAQQEQKTDSGQKMKNEDKQLSKKEKNINIQEKSKVGANQLDSVKREVGKDDVGNVQKRQHVKDDIGSGNIPSEGNVNNIKIESVQKTNVKVESTGEVLDTCKLQVDIDKAKVLPDSNVTVNFIENAPIGKETVLNGKHLDSNLVMNHSNNVTAELSYSKIFVNNINMTQTHTKEKSKPTLEKEKMNESSELNINNEDNNYKPLELSDSTLPINYTDKTLISIDNKVTAPPDSITGINNINDKTSDKVNNNNYSRDKTCSQTTQHTNINVENKAQVNKDDKTNNEPSDSKLFNTNIITSKTNETLITNHIGTSSNTNNGGTQNSLPNLNKIDNNVNKKPENKIKNHKTETQAQKERRNRRINKKLMLLRDQLAEIQQDLNVAKESISGTSN